MQVPVKESPIHTSSKFGDHKDAQAIRCCRQWNCGHDDQRFPSPGAQVGAVQRMSPKHLESGYSNEAVPLSDRLAANLLDVEAVCT